MTGEEDKGDVGSAPTVAADEGDGSDRSPSQQELHDDVKDALFGGGKQDKRESGTVFAGRYRLVALLGRGGMGEVYRAHDLVLGEDVALKFLPARYARSPGLMERFVEEARVARQVTHPHVCRVHDIGEADGKLFLSMEYVDGEDLASLLSRIGRLPLEKAYELSQQLCSGLAALHEKGVLHRDLKPSNVMIDGRGQIKLLDFGLAAIGEELRAEQLRDGTPAYMAPEQAAGEGVDERSDIFALGLVIYELITGTHAFASGTDASGAPRIDRSRSPTDASRIVRDVPRDLDEVLQACLDPVPAQRPSSVLSVALALPGGDPVAAAIAAGRAPSVDAIAGVRRSGYIAPWIAYACAAFIAVSTLAFTVLGSSTTVLGLIRPDLSPDVLVDRARTTLTAAGVSGEPTDTWMELDFDSTMLRNREGARPPLSPEADSPLRFRYRRSPRDLMAENALVRYADPPLAHPGELRLTLDSRGLLRDLTVVPPEELPPPASPYDFTPLVAATGADPTTVTPAEPRFTPPFETDQHEAWTATLPTGTEVYIEGSALRGQVVDLTVVPPWDRRAQPADARSGGNAGIGPIGGLLLFAVLILLAWLARRSVRRGDADVPGAFRVGGVVAVLHALVLALFGHHGGMLVEVNLAFEVLKSCAAVGGATVVIYVIVEPYARRFLPGAMVSWTRLVTARWRDPLVARDLLVATTFAAALVWATKLDFFTTPDRVPSGVLDLDVFLGTRFVFGALAIVLQDGILGPLGFFLLFLILRVVTRGTRRAAVGFFLLLAASNIAQFGSEPHVILVRVALAAVVATALIAMITRFGLLTLVAAQVVANLYFAFPLSTHFGAWWGSVGVVSLACITAITIFGLRCARPPPAVPRSSSA